MQALLSTADKTDSGKIWSPGIVNMQTLHKSHAQIYVCDRRTTVPSEERNCTTTVQMCIMQRSKKKKANLKNNIMQNSLLKANINAASYGISKSSHARVFARVTDAQRLLMWAPQLSVFTSVCYTEGEMKTIDNRGDETSHFQPVDKHGSQRDARFKKR